MILLATAVAFSGSMALAALSAQGLVDSLTAAGYTRIEVKTGPTQTKVEAIRGTDTLEQVLDNASGNVLKSETGTVEPGSDTSPGVSIKTGSKDFIHGDTSEDSATDETTDGDAGTDDGDGHDAGDDHGDDHDGEHDGGGEGGGDGGGDGD